MAKCPDCKEDSYKEYTKSDGSTYYACTSCGRKDFGVATKTGKERRKEAKTEFGDAKDRITLGRLDWRTAKTKTEKAKAVGTMARSVGGMAKAGTKYAAEATGAADVGREVAKDVRKAGRKAKSIGGDIVKTIIWGLAGGPAAAVSGWILVSMILFTIPALNIPIINYYHSRYLSPYLWWTKQGMQELGWWWWFVPLYWAIFIPVGIVAVWSARMKDKRPMFFGPGMSKGVFIAAVTLAIINYLVIGYGFGYVAGQLHLDEICPPGVPLCGASREVDKAGEVWDSLEIDDDNKGKGLKFKWTESGKPIRGKIFLTNQNPLDPDKIDLYTIKQISVIIKDEEGTKLGDAVASCSVDYPCDLKPQETKKEVGILIEGGLSCSEAKLRRVEEAEKVLTEDKELIIEAEYFVELEGKKQFDLSRTEKDRSAVELPFCKVSPGPIDLCLSFDDDRYSIYTTFTPRLVAPGGFLKIVSAQELIENPVPPTMYVSLINKMRGDGKFQKIRVRQISEATPDLLELDNCDGVELGECGPEFCLRGDNEEFTIEFQEDLILPAGKPTEDWKGGIFDNMKDIFCQFKEVDIDLTEDKPTVSFEFVGFSDYTYIDKKETVTGIYCRPKSEEELESI